MEPQSSKPNYSLFILLVLVAIIIVIGLVCLDIFVKNGPSDLEIDIAKYDRIINSASSKEEAMAAVESEYNDESFGTKNTVTKNEIIEETGDYYGLAVSWNYQNGDYSKTYNENAISFKKKTYDYQYSFSHTTGGTVKTNQINTKNKGKIKTILDTIYKIKNKKNGSFRWTSSELTENTNEFVYQLKYKKYSEGDWDVEDSIDPMVITVSIDKSTGNIGEETVKEDN